MVSWGTWGTWGITTDLKNRHIGNFSGLTKKKGKTLSFNQYPVNIFCSSTLSRKSESSHFLFCDVTVLLRWSLQYGRRWLQFPNNRYSIQSYFSDQWISLTKQTPALRHLSPAATWKTRLNIPGKTQLCPGQISVRWGISFC